MNRRKFIKISATGMAGILCSRMTYAQESHRLMAAPDEVWVESKEQWIQLKPAGNGTFAYNDIEFKLKVVDGSTKVFIMSPKNELSAISVKWKQQTDANKIYGDDWERTYGNAGWKKPKANIRNPWYVLLYDEKRTACFGVKTGCSTVCWWVVKSDCIELIMDTQSGGMGVLLSNRELHAADIITLQSLATETPFLTARRFCGMMCEKPRLPKAPVYGINDWYYAYGNNSPKLIKEQTALMAELATDTDNRPFSVIDAGWAAYSPLLPNDCCWQEDFSMPNEKFKDMHAMAGNISKLGMRPGLWTRPLCARHDDAASLLAPKIKGRDDPKNPVLDPTIPENIERVRRNIEIYRQWGFEMVKHDFSTYDILGRWGFDMTDAITQKGWAFNDRSKTNAEIINNLYSAIRQSAGDRMYVIGCNTMSHLSAGVFELNRIGDDTSGKEWDRTRKMGVNSLAFRMMQHGTFYAADGDCVGLTNQIPWDKNKQWMQLLAESSAPLFISAQPDALRAEQRAFIKTCFAKAAKHQPVAEPLDWLTNSLPAKWKLDDREVTFNWG